MADAIGMASQRWADANEILQEAANVCADSACTMELVREHEAALWAELLVLRDDLDRFDRVQAELEQLRTQMRDLAPVDHDDEGAGEGDAAA